MRVWDLAGQFRRREAKISHYRPLRLDGRRSGAQPHDTSTIKRRLATNRSTLGFESFADAGAFGAKLNQDRECTVERCVAPLFLERTGKLEHPPCAKVP